MMAVVSIPIVSVTVEGWRLTLRVLLRLLQRLLAALAKLFRRLRRGRGDKGERDYRDIRCLTPPPQIRARPDPFIYSQQWLSSRGFAITWDNPDFRIIDPATGAAVDRFSLLPNTDYEIEARIHNGSFMAALSTSVRFQVRGFGAGTALLSDLGEVTLDVPAMGNALARAGWHTPATGGHNCLLDHLPPGRREPAEQRWAAQHRYRSSCEPGASDPVRGRKPRWRTGSDAPGSQELRYRCCAAQRCSAGSRRPGGR